MKEEQNASSSANYDVEIIHDSDAHAGLRAMQPPLEAGGTVTLRWWTPRGAEGGAAGAGGALWRVTPADVASRPSACLVNFLLNGRSVTLELPRKGGGRSASHILAAHGGELWIGAIGGKIPHDDPPSLSEGVGGRVTDYRIKDFGALMQQNRLCPLRGPGALGRAKAKIMRHTTYWPLTISSTLIFNLGPVVEPLARLVVQETLSEEEVGTCRAVLCTLLGLEARHEPPAPHLATPLRSKWGSGRREEQWRQVWGELEALVRAHAASPGHRALLRCLLECRTPSTSTGAHDAAGADPATRASVIRATTDSPLSPPPAATPAVWASRGILDELLGPPRPPTRPDFAGRLTAGSRPATLYPQLLAQQQLDVEASH